MWREADQKKEVAGQPLENIARGRQQQAPEDGRKGIKFLKTAPDAALTVFRAHVLGKKIADHAQISFRLGVVHPPGLIQLLPHGGAPPGGGHIEKGHGGFDALQKGQGLLKERRGISVQPEHKI